MQSESTFLGSRRFHLKFYIVRFSLPDYEVSSYLMHAEQLRKLVVSTVKYVVEAFFVRYFAHRFGIVSRCSCYMEEGQILCFHIV